MKNKTDFAYQTVYRYLIRLINEAQSGPAVRLPSLRQLARRLRVSISTVQNAYSLLEKEGKVCAVPKSGYFARPNVLPESPSGDGGEEDDLLEMFYSNARRPGMLVLGSDDPTLVQSLEHPLLMLERELVRQYPKPLDPCFQPFGDIELRAALAARYTVSAQRCWYPEDVFIGPDFLGVLTVVLETLHVRDGTVLVESPCHWALLRLLQSLNVRVIELPLDGDGCINLQALDQSLLTDNVSLAILPSLVSPVRGCVGPAYNRKAMAELLNRYRVWVLENDSHGDLGFVPCNQRLRHLIDAERLLIIGTFDKQLGAEAPYGYLLGKHFTGQWQQYFLLRSFNLAPIRQKALARLCNAGRIDLHLTELGGLLEQRMRNMAQLLDRHVGPALSYELPQGGAAIWAQSVQGVDMRKVFNDLLPERIVIAPGELFSLQGLHRQCLRISYALDNNRPMAPVLDKLAEALDHAQLR